MRKKVFALLIAYCLLVSGRPSALPSRNLASLRNIAIRRAERDVRAGHARLFEAGTIMIYVAGVEPDHPMLAVIPHAELPNGCTNEEAPFWVVYAEAYNATVIKHLPRPNVHASSRGEIAPRF